MPRIALLGPPASGKGTQAAKTAREYGIPVISTGDILRENIEKRTVAGLAAKSYMEAGELVPDDFIILLVRERLEALDKTSGYLLDGFPRTVEQAMVLDNCLVVRGRRLDKVFYLNVCADALLDRIAKRRICPSCNTSYPIRGLVQKKEGYCDECGTELIKRKDDDLATAAKRIEVYNEMTKPLICYYKEQGILVELDGTLGTDALHEQIDSALRQD